MRNGRNFRPFCFIDMGGYYPPDWCFLFREDDFFPYKTINLITKAQTYLYKAGNICLSAQ